MTARPKASLHELAVFGGEPAFTEPWHVGRPNLGNRADFLIVYTRESHAVGEWEVERNKRARILVEQPTTMEQRKALARQAKQALKITIPIAIDTMDDKTIRDYGGFTTCAVVIGRDGHVAAYRTHGDPTALRRLIDQTIAGKPAATTNPS